MDTPAVTDPAEPVPDQPQPTENPALPMDLDLPASRVICSFYLG